LMTYQGLFYESLISEGRLSPSGLLPQVIPIVVYNGVGGWGPVQELSELIERLDPSAEPYVPRLRYKLVHEAAYDAEELGKKESPVADLFQLERSTSWSEIQAGVIRLQQHVTPGEPELRRAFEGWLRQVVLPRLGVAATEMPERLTLEEFESMLAERIDSWNEKLRQESRQEGRQEGEAKLLLRVIAKRFGPVDPAIHDRIASADADLLLEWADRFTTAESLADIFGD
jgi:hypothetical protein